MKNGAMNSQYSSYVKPCGSKAPQNRFIYVKDTFSNQCFSVNLPGNNYFDTTKTANNRNMASTGRKATNKDGGGSILVNPNFKHNVHINPKFNKLKTSLPEIRNTHASSNVNIYVNPASNNINNIHINPKVITKLNSISDDSSVIKYRSESVANVNKRNELGVLISKSSVSHVTKQSSEVQPNVGGKVIVSTKNKLIRSSNQSELETEFRKPVESDKLKTKYKLVNSKPPIKEALCKRNPSQANSSTKLKNTVSSNNAKYATSEPNYKQNGLPSCEESCAKKRRLSIHTKYKIVRTTASKAVPVKGYLGTVQHHLVQESSRASLMKRKRTTSIRTKYKIVKSNSSINSKLSGSVRKSPSQRSVETQAIMKKKYLYVNRFSSISLIAKNVLLKQNSNVNKAGFININGILCRKFPNSLVRVQGSCHKLERKSMRLRSLSFSNKVTSKSTLGKVCASSKLRKSNIPCSIYRKFGRCSGKDNGKCIKIHNPNQINLCTKFLQGACLNKNCLLSHKVSTKKMPTCKYYLEGTCSREDCQYLHVRISPKADICKDFLQGFCEKASQCDKRHQFLCPDYEKNGSCPKRKCPYPHGNTVRNCSALVLNKIAKKSPKTKCSKVNNKTVYKSCTDKLEPVKIVAVRYYKEHEKVVNEDKCGTEEGDSGEKYLPMLENHKSRPTVGQLPCYIPLNNSS